MPTLITDDAAQRLDQRYDRWMTTEQAAERIGVSARTIRTWIGNGTLRKLKKPVSGSPAIVIVNPEDVDREAALRRAPLPMPPPATQENAALFDAIALRHAPTPPAPLNFDLESAAKYCNLPKRLLLRAIKEQRLPAHRWAGEHFIARADLEAFRPAPVAQLAWSKAE